MNAKRIFLVSVAVAVIALAYFAWKLTARSAYETAKYSMLQSDGQFEIRQYEDVMMATTDMQFASQGDDGSFMRLFRYIGGENAAEQKISMTTPVFMAPEGSDSAAQMGFVLPEKVAQDSIPEPSHDGVQIQKRDGGRFAVIRFSGRMNDETVANAERRLRKWIKDNNLVGAERAECAGYDPPWTPGPWRRNEILVRLEGEP